MMTLFQYFLLSAKYITIIVLVSLNLPIIVESWELCHGNNDIISTAMWTNLREGDLYQTNAGSLTDRRFLDEIGMIAKRLMGDEVGDASVNYPITPALNCSQKLNHEGSADLCPLSGEVDPPWLHVAVKDCAFGVAQAMIMAVPTIEKWHGFQEALKYWWVFNQVRGRFDPSMIEEGYDWSLTSPQSGSYSFLLGRSPRSCFGSDLKVFVYPYNEASDRPFKCSQGMFASEVFVHKFFEHSACRTHDPNEADFFFVPFYAACVMTSNNTHTTRIISDLYEEVLASLPYLNRKGQRDHIILWSSEFWDYPDWKTNIHEPVFLTVEGTPIDCPTMDYVPTSKDIKDHCWRCTWCYNPWKDFLIPGFVERWSIHRMLMFDVHEEQDRRYIACYHGSDAKDLDIYVSGNATVRTDIVDKMAGLPYTSIGKRFPYVMEYFDRIGQCKFCLVPKGLGYWSNRLYEIMFMGCIPVILSDHIHLPFPDKIPWQEMSIKLPQEQVGYEMWAYLVNLVKYEPSQVAEMRHKLRQHRCWIDYHSDEENCSPYRAIVDYLVKRKQVFPTYPGRHWPLNDEDIEINTPII